LPSVHERVRTFLTRVNARFERLGTLFRVAGGDSHVDNTIRVA
jgi:hypothetical protein